MATPSVNPDTASDAVRTEKRRAAGMRAAWIWGGVLVVLALIFTILYLALDARREKAWRRSIESALKREDAAECAALLAACRREQPGLAKQALFAAWESRYLALQSRRETRRNAFEAKFAGLEKALNAEDRAKRDWPQELAELARLADTEEELSRIQSLRLRSEALSRTEKLSAAAAVAKKLAAARAELKRLAELRKMNDFEAFAKLQSALHHELEALKLATQGNPDLAESFRRLEVDFKQETAAGKRAGKAFSEEEKAYRDILAGTQAAEIMRRIQSYLARYPESPKNAMLRGVLAELGWIHYPWLDESKRALEALNKREKSARTGLCHALEVLQSEHCLLAAERRAKLESLWNEVKALDAKNFAAWLDNPHDIPAGEVWSSEALKAIAAAKKTLSPDAETLHVPAGAWHTLNWKLWNEAALNTPCFAGLLVQGKFRSSGVTRQGSDVWLAGYGGSAKPHFIRAGVLNGTEFVDEVGVNSILCTLWVPSGEWQAAARRVEFEREATALGASPEALRFPCYWVKK